MYNTSWGTSIVHMNTHIVFTFLRTMWQWDHTRMTLHNKLYPSTSWKWNHNTHYKWILYVHIIYVCMYMYSRTIVILYICMYTFYTKETQLLTLDNTLYLHTSSIILLTVSMLKMFGIQKRSITQVHTLHLHTFSTCYFNLTHWCTSSLVTCSSSSQWAGRLG